MRPGILGYLVKEGLRSIKQNSFMAVASVLVLISCLLLSGAAYLCFVNVESAFQYLDDQNVAVVWAVETATDDEVAQLGDQLRAMSNVEKVEFLSKEEVLERYKDRLPDAIYESVQGESNPMLDGQVVTFRDLSLIEQTLGEIRAMPLVDDVSAYVETAQILVHVRNAVLTVGGWIIVLLLLVSLFIISNTIKLTVYSRRLEIGIMKSVGATRMFIRIPFMVEGMVLGLTAGALSFGILYFVYNRLSTMIRIGFVELINIGQTGLTGLLPVWAELLIGFLLIGMLTGMLGSGISIGRYLKEEGGVGGEL